MKDNLLLIILALIIGLGICALALIPVFTDKSRECEKYADKPITEAPAKCIEYFGGVR